MRYHGTVYRPPSEANSLIIQATLGCTHNSCSFCPMFSDKRFKVRSFDEVLDDLKQARCEYPYVRRIFYADGNALCLTNEKLLPLLAGGFPRMREGKRVCSRGKCSAKDRRGA